MMHTHKIFNSLARNGFDFLHRAIAEFDQAPKYSVIHFCSAVETLLKARLMQEHWSLVIARPEQANLAQFKAGDFKSATLEDCRARLHIAGEDIGDKAYHSFRTLANHRNKMVHFFHDGLENNQKAKEDIAAEQCLAWFYLHGLLQRWSEHFNAFQSNIQHANHAMLQHRKYLDEKFKALKPELDAARQAGNPPETCPACEYKALDTQPGDRYVHESCRICGYVSPSHKAVQQGEEVFVANCLQCGGYETVLASERGYVCQSCKKVFSDYISCEYCQSNWAGESSETYGDYLTGCDHCEGALSYMMEQTP